MKNISADTFPLRIVYVGLLYYLDKQPRCTCCLVKRIYNWELSSETNIRVCCSSRKDNNIKGNINVIVINTGCVCVFGGGGGGGGGGGPFPHQMRNNVKCMYCFPLLTVS